MTKLKRYFVGGLFLVVALFVFNVFTSYYPDFLWFQSFGLDALWLLQFKSQIAIWALFFGGTLSVFWLNIWLANKIVAKSRPDTTPEFRTSFGFLNQLLTEFARRANQSQVSKLSKAVVIAIAYGISFVVALLIGGNFKFSWLQLLSYSHAQQFHITDPLFGLDIGTFVFKLPVWELLNGWFSSVMFLSIIAVVWIYFTQNLVLYIFHKHHPVKSIKIHLFTLIGLWVISLSAGAFLNLLNLVFASDGVVFGAGYTDVHVMLPYYKAMAIGLLLLGITFIIWGFLSGIRGPLLLILILMAMKIGFGGVLPSVIQNYVVSPNELEKEVPYIQRNIEYTRKAFGLDKIEPVDFPAKTNLTASDINNNQTIINNIRLWNTEPIKQTFSQLQEIRLYYEFKNVDVSRYMIDGNLRQVMTSPRELDVNQLASDAQTWVNQHLIYTHGYGMVMSPVNIVTPEGLPELYIKDIPPRSETHINITRPEIYFGESANKYVVVNTAVQEFNYPKGDDNAYTHYSAEGGVKLSSFFRRLMFALKFSESKLFFTRALTKDSRLIYDRKIDVIVKKVFPFIHFDTDPYMVITEEGHQVWIIDGYTLSKQFPYAQTFNSYFNYIRNSVKITIDAYTGELNAYISDPSDPIINTYAKVMPNTFKSKADMPLFLREHIRYPKELFTIQTLMYRTYHMTNPRVFYNKEDLWNIPRETYEAQEQVMDSYYMVSKLPGEEKESFILVRPYTPSNKNNMIGWMAVKCDFDEYGKISVFKLPKERTIYGPRQIESRIDQDTEISQKLTLWGQVGSRVIRGNIMIVPIEDSLVYVEPVYLQATQSKLPELKRVIVAYGDRIIMEETLPKGFEHLFDYNHIEEPRKSDKPNTDTKSNVVSSTIDILKKEFKSFKSHAKSAEWGKLGNSLDKLQKLIEEL